MAKANDNEQLIFPMGIDVNIEDFKTRWKAQEANIQKIIDTSNFKIKVNIDQSAVKGMLDALKQVQEFQKTIANTTSGASKSSPASMLKARTIADAKATEMATIAEAKAKAILVNSDNQTALAEQRLANIKQQGITVASKSAIASTNESVAEEKLARAKNQTAISSQKLARETLGQTSAYKSQFGIISGLKSMAMQYLTVMGGFRLVQQIKSITSQYELQRVALGAIIQDVQRANQLFDQIKVLAIASPFTVMQLTSYTKQLAAYRVETENLFDTTSRLADISAGLGVDMERLILAYGQVKAASVLRGQEMRQFSEAGIPMISLLADKFTKLNGEVVTTAQVFKLISQRAVPFKMIEEIFKDMTNEGGVFFHMQEIQSKTLWGVYMNLTDAVQIMFDEMGRSQRGLLMGIGHIARSMTKEWRGVLATIGPVVIAIAAYNIALMFSNRMMVAGAATEKLLAKAALLNAAGMTASATATTAAAGATNFLTRSLYKLWAAMLANPVAWIVAGITLVGLAIYKIVSYKDKVERMQADIAKTMSEIKAAADMSVISLDNLTAKLKNANYGSQEYADIVAEINRKYGDFLPNQLKASQSYDEIAKSIIGVTDAIMNQAKAKSYDAGIQKIEGNFAEQSSKAYDEAMKALTKPKGGMKWLGFALDDKEAAALIEKGLEQVKANPKIYSTAKEIGDLLSKNLNEAWQAKGFTATQGLLKGIGEVTVEKYVKGVQGMLAPWQAINAETEKFKAKNDAIFETTQMSNFKREVEDLNLRYKALREEKGRQTYTDDVNGVSVQRNIDLRKLEGTQMTVLISLYKKYGQYKQAADTGAQLSMFYNQGKDWKSALEKLLSQQVDKNGNMKRGLSDLRPEENQDYIPYVEELQGKYDKLLTTQKIISKGKLIPPDEVESTINQLEAIIKVADMYGVTLTKSEDKATKAANPRIAKLKEEITVAEQAYTEYKKLADERGAVYAQEYIKKAYAGTSPLGLAFSPEQMKGIYDKASAEFGGVGTHAASEMSKNVLKGTEVMFDAMSDQFKERLDELGTEISNTQKANDFYEKMLGLTGDAELSKKIALQVTGFKTGDVADKLQKQLEEIGKKMNIKIPIAVSGRVDIEGTRKAIDDALSAGSIGKDTKDLLTNALQSYSDNEATVISELFSSLGDYQTFEQRKAKIIADGEKMATDATSRGLMDQGAAIRKFTDTKTAELGYENFKTTDAYVEMFGDLDNLTTDALENIKAKLVEMSKGSLSGLSPASMKEIVSKIEDLSNKIIERNPFKAWAESLKKIEALKTTISNLEGTVDAGNAVGLDPVLLEVLVLVLAKLKKELAATEHTGKAAFAAMSKEITTIYNAVQEVVTGVKAIFDEFGVGEDTLAGKSVSLLETIGSGVMKVIQQTAIAAAAAVKGAERASVILTVISVVLQVALKAYQLFSAEAGMQRKIEALAKDVAYLQEMYDKLSSKNNYNPEQLDRLQEELGLRKELLEVTKRQMEAEAPGLNKSVKQNIWNFLQGALTGGISSQLRGDTAGAINQGMPSLIRAIWDAGKIKKYNEYITEANKRIAYQLGLYDILNSDMNNIAKNAKAKVENLDEQNRLLKQQLATEIALGRKMDVTKVLDLQQQIAKNEVDKAYAYLDTVQEVIGDVFTNMTDSITDALSTAWENGTDGALAYGETVKKVMQNVVTSLWKANVLSTLMQPVMAELYKSMGLTADGKVVAGTTPDFNIDANEMAAIMKTWAAVESGILSSWDGVENVLDAMGSGPGEDLTGISKGIATASEESVVTLSGYANSLLYYSVGQYNIQQEMLAIMKSASPGGAGGDESLAVMTSLYNIQAQALSQLQAIAANTSRSAVSGESIVDALNKLSLTGGKSLNVKLID